MNKKSSLVFFGNERLSTATSTDTPTLRSLIKAGYEIKAIVTNYEKSTSRTSRELEIKSVAQEHSIPLLIPSKLSDIESTLREYKADAAILVAYGKMVPQSIIDIFPRGIINIHPSLLPLHRGPIPIESVLLNGENTTGVSVIQLVKKMDAGPIYKQSAVELTGSETKKELTQRLSMIGSEMVTSILPDILSGEIVPRPQNESLASYDGLITKSDGLIDWLLPAQQIERQIRAYSGWPKSRTKLHAIDVVITDVFILEESGKAGKMFIHNKRLGVYCGEGSLIIDKLMPTGKKEMSSEAFLAGYKKRLGL